jgi:hypothetical protein
MATNDNKTTSKPFNYDRLAKGIADPHRASAEVFVKISGFTDQCAYGVAKEFKRSAQSVAEADLTGIEATLTSQMHVLNVMFINMSKKHVEATHWQEAQVYGALALKAHTAFRQTFATFAELKNPKAAAPTNAVQVNVHASGEKSGNGLLTAGPNATLDA